MIGACVDASVIIIERIILLRASLPHTFKTRTIIKALHSIDAQHCQTQLGMQLREGWFAQAYRTAPHHTSDDAADGVTFLLHIQNQLFHLLCLHGVSTAHRIHLYLSKVQILVTTLHGNMTYL